MTNTRERLITASAELFRRQGFAATGLKRIVAAADAQLGSLYHFFPGGKEQLAEEVIRWSGRNQLETFDRFFQATTDPAIAIGDFFTDSLRSLRETGYTEACPITTIALEAAGTSEPLRRATAEVFESWIAGLADRFVAAGIPEPAARGLAVTTLSTVEGAFVLCRATRDPEAIEVARATLVAAVEAARVPARAGGHEPPVPADGATATAVTAVTSGGAAGGRGRGR